MDMRNKNAFTLTELLIVMAIIGMLAGIGYAYLSNGKTYLKKDVRILYNYLSYMRIKAIQLKNRTYLEFDITNNSYSLNYDNGSILKTVNLSSKIEFGDGGHSSLSNHKVAFGSTSPPKAYFFPDGSCSPSGSIYLKEKSSNDSVYKVTVSLSGNISISHWNGSAFATD
jgi:prepilin-type N-terminal cleavage/methylation domain-containing protein